MNRFTLLALLVLSALVASAALPTAEAAVCGDAIIQAPNDNGFYEQCDEGIANGNLEAQCGEDYESSTCSYCSWRCTDETYEPPEETFCGDGRVQAPNDNNVYEECDEGLDNTDLIEAPYGETANYCSNSCTSESEQGGYCGDGICQSDFENAFTCGTDCSGGGTGPTFDMDLYADPNEGDASLQVRYSCAGAYGVSPYTITLSFGDGETIHKDVDTALYGYHTYDEAGTYTMRCTVRDRAGESGSDSETIIVNEPDVDIDSIAFFVTPDEGATPLDVRYGCNATGGNGDLSYRVTWGDGSASQGMSGSHTYTLSTNTNERTYTATCTATDADGDTKRASDSTRVYRDTVPTARFTANDTQLYVDESYYYTCTGSGGEGTLRYRVFFDDGASTSRTSGTHAYSSPGTYDAGCTVTDENGYGESDTDTETITVIERPDLKPNVDLDAYPTAGISPLDVNYSCTISGGDAPITSRVTFGDGGSANVLAGSHTYGSGSYTMTCTATDADGDTASDSVTISVGDPLDAELIATPNTGTAPLDVDYACLAKDGTYPYSYRVGFGDGSARVSGANGDHTYDAPGTYTMTCYVEDAAGATTTATQTIAIGSAPKVSLSVDPTSGQEPLDVDYACSVSGGDAPITTQLTRNGQALNSLSGSTTLDAGTHTFTCTARDADGQTDSASKTVMVAEKPDLKPSVDLNVTPTSGYAPLDITYACDVSGGDAPVSSSLRIDDVSQPRSGSYTFDEAGSYDVVCSARDVDGDTDSETITVTVMQRDLKPHVELSAAPTYGDAPLDVNYSCDVKGGDAPVSTIVTFGDGSQSNALSSIHTYDEPGSYTMTCTATDVDGDTHSDSVSIKVKESDIMPHVDLDVSPTEGVAPLSVNYSCDVSGGNDPVTATVSVGDSTTSALDGEITFETAGTFKIICEATDADGDTHSDSVTVTVRSALDATLDVEPMTGLEPLDVGYACSATGGLEPYTYALTFGDGDASSAPAGSHTYAAGEFWMTCEVRDAMDRVAYASTKIEVDADRVPHVDLSAAPTYGDAPLDVNYSCDVSGGDAPVSTIVTFGDGSQSNLLDSAHTYDEPGYYTMTCTATDVDGDVRSDSVQVKVKQPDLAPHVEMSATPTSGEASLYVNYSCDVSGGDAPVSTTLMMNQVSLDDLSGLFVFIREGEYTFTCTATDADGDTDSDSVTVHVTEQDLVPHVELTAEPTWGYAPMDVRYSCDVSGGNDPVSTIVTFGDGSSSSDLDSSYTYDEPGYYTMTCTATDVDGDTHSDSVLLRVKQPDFVPIVDLDVSPTEGEAPLSVDYSCDVSGGNDPVNAFVRVGSATSTALDGEIVFEQPGSYEVVCTATDADGDSDSDSVTVTVREKDVAPLVELTATPPEGYAPLDVEYRCAVSGGNAPVVSRISFSEGATTSDLVGTRTYSDPGTYAITCTATDADGDTDSETVELTVLDKGNGPYDIDFSATPDFGVEPFETFVSCEAFGGIDPITYEVYFGDSRTGTFEGIVEADVEYDYGVYDLTCTATDAFDRSMSADERVVVLPDSSVDITPDAPGDSDTLACAVTEYPNDTFTFVWTINGEEVAQTDDSSATLAATYTNVGDVIECIAYLPNTEYEIGRDTETIRYTGPTAIDFDVSPNSGDAPLEVSWMCVADGVEPIDYEIAVEWNDMVQDASSATGLVLMQPANYTFTCTATDANGDSISAQDFVEVTPVDYSDSWSISANPRSGPAPLTVVFDANTSDIPIVGEVLWDFDDGLEGLGVPIAHTFPRVGTYVVTAYATLEDSRVLEKDVTITVTPAQDEEPQIDMDRVRIQHTYAEIVGDTLYATVTVRNDAGTTIDRSVASIYLPDHNTYASTEMPRIRDNSQETVQFFVELDGQVFDPIAVFVVQNEDIRLQDATIVVG